jgi:Na+-transporting NADH:ubiquinone oxidoreductase subunit A
VQFKFHKGLDLDMGAGPSGELSEPPAISKVALSGHDYPGIVFDLRVGEGESVSTGQVLCVDRGRPEISFVASAAGQITRITLGARRRLETLVISVEGNTERQFDPEPASTDAAALRRLLLNSGAWAGFRSRPFGSIPDPDNRPAAIFVTATDTNPLAADPAALLGPQMEIFQRGTEALMRLTEGPVFICQVPGLPLVHAHDRLKIATFSGPHPAGLAGTHIHHMMPVSGQRSVWQIGYQDVAAIGHLLTNGRIMASRTISLAGPGLTNPALVTAPLGADLADLTRDQSHGNNIRLISGSVLSGHETTFLGRHDLQVTVMDRNAPAPSPRAFWHRLLDLLPSSSAGATLPMEAFERAFPLDLLPVPLMRALAVGDVETAARLGCLELLEEDFALLSWLCPSRSDYGALLRRVLNTLAEEGSA